MPGEDYAAQAAALPAVVRLRRLARFVVPLAVVVGLAVVLVLSITVQLALQWLALIIVPLPFAASGLAGYFRWRADRIEQDFIALAEREAE